jgi:hypothetical protein
VLEAVKAAECSSVVPDSVATSLTKTDKAEGKRPFDCAAVIRGSLDCAYGDQNASKLMVIYGDSRAVMWSGALEVVAAKYGWKLRVWSMGGCPVPALNFLNIGQKTPFT